MKFFVKKSKDFITLGRVENSDYFLKMVTPLPLMGLATASSRRPSCLKNMPIY